MEPPDPGKLWPPRHCARYRGAPYPDLSRTPVPSTEKASASDQKIQAGEQHFGTAEIQFKGFATFATLTTMLYYLSIKSE